MSNKHNKTALTSQQTDRNHNVTPVADVDVDVAEMVVHNMHFVLPIAGAVLVFLLAFIAVTMA